MYKWNLEKIKELLTIYKNKLAATTDPVSQMEITSTIESIKDLINYYKNITSITSQIPLPSFPNFKDVIEDDLDLIQELGSLFPLVHTFSDTFDYENIRSLNPLPKRVIPNQKIVAMTASFYYGQSDIFKDAYCTLSSNFQSRLRFHKNSPFDQFAGETKAIYGTNYIFINSGKNNNFSDFTNLIHESSHGIAFLLNPQVIWEHSKFCYREIDALFFELIGTEHAAKITMSPQEAHTIKLATFKDYLYSAHLISTKSDMYNTLSEADLKKTKIVKEYYQTEMGFDKIGINDLMHSYIRQYFHYIISFLTAIELYLLYQVNKNYALDLLYKIIMFKDKEPNDYLNSIKELGINPGENTEKYYQSLYDEDRKLCYGRNIQL